MWRYQQSQLAVRFEHYSTANIAPSCLSFELKMEPDIIRTKYCRNCKNRINFMHFEIHQERCRPPINVIKPSPSNLKKEVQKKEQSKHQSEDEVFPCHLCGFKQTLKDLDTHQFKCLNQEIECPHCKVSFPKALMNDHKPHCLRQATSGTSFSHRFEVAQISVPPSHSIIPTDTTDQSRKKVEIKPKKPSILLHQSSQIYRDKREERHPNTSASNSFSQDRIKPNIHTRSREVLEREREQRSESSQNENSQTNLHFPHLNRHRIERGMNRPMSFSDFKILMEMDERQKQNERLKLQQQSEQLIRRAIHERNEAMKREQIIRERNTAISLREEQLRIEEQRFRQLATQRERQRNLEEQLKLILASKNEQRNRMKANEQIRLQAEQRRRRLENQAAAEEELRRQANARRQQAVQRLASRRNNSNQADGLTKTDLRKIKNIKYKKTSKEEETCSICCNELLDKQLVKDLPCKHFYHTDCISKWLMINKTCPLCKSDISQVVKLIKEDEIKRKMSKMSKKMNNSSTILSKSPHSSKGLSSQSVSRSIDWLQEDVEEADLNYLQDFDEQRGLIMRDRQ